MLFGLFLGVVLCVIALIVGVAMYDAARYPYKRPNYGKVYEVKDFIEYCRNGQFSDSDGNALPCRDNRVANVLIYPSNYQALVRDYPDAKYVIWVGK